MTFFSSDLTAAAASSPAIRPPDLGQASGNAPKAQTLRGAAQAAISENFRITKAAPIRLTAKRLPGPLAGSRHLAV